MEQEKNGTVKESMQYNQQDMDQEQNVNMNPKQTNTQGVNVFVVNEKKDDTCKITGTTYIEKANKIIANVNIILFFGYDSNVPVFQTKSDKNGNFQILDLPPGFYTIAAKYGEYRSRLKYVKILPGQKISQNIRL